MKYGAHAVTVFRVYMLKKLQMSFPEIVWNNVPRQNETLEYVS